MRRLEQAEEDLAAVDKRLEQATAVDAVVTKIKEQPRVGTVTAVTLRAAIGR